MERRDQQNVGTSQKIVASNDSRYRQVTPAARHICSRLLEYGYPEVEMLVVLAEDDLIDGALVDPENGDVLVTLGACGFLQVLRCLEAKPGNERVAYSQELSNPCRLMRKHESGE